MKVWEAQLVAGDHDPQFACHAFVFDRATAEEDVDPGTDEDRGQDAGQATDNGGNEDEALSR